MHLAAGFLIDHFVVLINYVENLFGHFHSPSDPPLESGQNFCASRTNCSSVAISARMSKGKRNSFQPSSNLSAGQPFFNSFSIILRRCEKLLFTRLVKVSCSRSVT